EGIVGGIGAGPAALDVVDAELVERARDGDLVRHGEVDALGLRPVAQGRIEEIDPPVARHVLLSCPLPSPRPLFSTARGARQLGGLRARAELPSPPRERIVKS